MITLDTARKRLVMRAVFSISTNVKVNLKNSRPRSLQQISGTIPMLPSVFRSALPMCAIFSRATPRRRRCSKMRRPLPSSLKKMRASQEEEDACLARLEEMLDSFEIESWFDGPYDDSGAILTIHPGSGGLEAQDWTEMLYKMYSHYADKKGWKTRLLDLVPGEGIGLDRVSMQIEGRHAYGMLRSETGVHRLVRISPTDEKKRRHTTFAAVEVVPVLEENDIEIEIDPNDVRVDVYRSSGPVGRA